MARLPRRRRKRSSCIKTQRCVLADVPHCADEKLLKISDRLPVLIKNGSCIRHALRYIRAPFAIAAETYQPVEKGVIDRVSRHGEAYRGEGGFAILRDDEDDLNDQDGSSGRNKHEQGANSAGHGLLRGAGADELAHQQR